MAARPVWRGQIRLALVSIPVELFPATKSGATIAFHQVHEPTGKRIRYEKVVPGVGAVDKDEIVKGYEISKGEYVLLDPEEIEKVKLESRKTLDLSLFVDADEALKQARKIGIGQLAMRGQEYIVALKPCSRGMILETLRYADEVNKASGYFRDIGDEKPDPDLLEMAASLIERKTGEFEPAEFHNRYVDALKALIEEKKKKKGKLVIQDPDEGLPSGGSNVIDLMAALKKSLGESDAQKPAKKSAVASKPAPRRSSSRKPPERKTAGRKRA